MKRVSKLLAVAVAVIIAISSFPSAIATAQSDVVISTYAQLKDFADKVNGGESFEGKNIKLEVNVDLGSDSNPWTSIGTAKATSFKGNFDGGNHVISGLYINGSDSNVGFFGYVDGGTVENLTVEGNVEGSKSVGGVIGYLNVGTVKNCGNKARVKGGSMVGGVVGAVNGDCTVSGCYNSGSVIGTSGYIGGVTGQHWRAGLVENCYNAGDVTGPATVGGVTGGHKASSPVLKNCYSDGVVVDSAGMLNNIGAVLGAGKVATVNCYYKDRGIADTNGGAKAVGSYSEASLGDAFDNTALVPKLLWEKNVSGDKPVHPEFAEATKLSSQLAAYIKAAIQSAKAKAGVSDTLLGSDGYKSGASSTATDWTALAMGRFGYYKSGKYCYMTDDGTGYDDYLAALKGYIEKTYSKNNGVLHRVKSTEWHRAVVAAAALGGNPESFGTYNGNNIDLIADGSYNNVTKNGPGGQGLNGWIWGLIAMDTGSYTVPANAKYSRETFITEILKTQLADGVGGNTYGGWVLGGYGSTSDIDMTAMAVQALAPYYNSDKEYTYTNGNTGKEETRTVHECVDDAIERLGNLQNINGGYNSWETENVESAAQVLTALCSVGIDPATDKRFITSSGKTLLDGILRFRLADGGFCHVLNGGFNSMANDQAAYSLVSYWRYENGMRALYDMRGDFSESDLQSINTAVSAINAIKSPTDADYKASLKAALTAFRAVSETENRYVYNYSKLVSAIELIGGEAELETNTPYAVELTVKNMPQKTVYIEGETLNTEGLRIAVKYSDGTEKETEDYKLSVYGELTLGIDTVYVKCGGLKTSFGIVVNEKTPWEGEGTAESPYLISDAEGLEALATKVNKGENYLGYTFKLTDNIDLSDYDNWISIGQNERKQFEGTFDGNGFAIDNLTARRNGLFAYAGDNAVIKNVGIASGEIGYETLSFVGAVVGYSNGADVINCYNGANVACSGWSGGVVGTVRNGSSVIKGCYNTGNITARNSVAGGVIGHLSTGVNAVVSDCYNTGKVTAEDSAAGVVAKIQGGGNKLSNCYNVGEISVHGVNILTGAASIAAELTRGSTVENCYYNSDICNVGTPDAVESSVAKTTAEMKEDNILTLLGSGFKKDKYALVNDGYPLLQWQKTEDADSVENVEKLIKDIGTVTLDSKAAIESARAAYNALDDSLKANISNLAFLEGAESAYKLLVGQSGGSGSGSGTGGSGSGSGSGNGAGGNGSSNSGSGENNGGGDNQNSGLENDEDNETGKGDDSKGTANNEKTDENEQQETKSPKTGEIGVNAAAVTLLIAAAFTAIGTRKKKEN